MNVLLRLALYAAGCVLVGVALTRTQPGGVSDFVPGLRCLPEDWAQLAEEDERSQELDDRRAALNVRMEAKVQIIQDLIAGRLTLLAAAARFRDLNSRPPHFHWGRFRMAYAGATDDEKHCNEVLAAVEACRGGRDSADPLVDRLRRELEQHVREGTLRLPE
jgi:hypothetical protein